MAINNSEFVKISTTVARSYGSSDVGFNLLYIDEYLSSSTSTVVNQYSTTQELDSASISNTKDIYKALQKYINFSVKPKFIYAMHLKNGEDITVSLNNIASNTEFFVIVLSNTLKAVSGLVAKVADWAKTNNKLLVLDLNEAYDKSGGIFTALASSAGKGSNTVGIYRKDSANENHIDFALGCLIIGSSYGSINPFIAPTFTGIAADALTSGELAKLTNNANFLARYDSLQNGSPALVNIRLIKSDNKAITTNISKYIKLWYTENYTKAKSADAMISRKPSVTPNTYMATVEGILQRVLQFILENNYAQLNSKEPLVKKLSVAEIEKYREDNSNKYPPVEINLVINEEPTSISLNFKIS